MEVWRCHLQLHEKCKLDDRDRGKQCLKYNSTLSKQVKIKGITGPLRFDEFGTRSNLKLRLLELKGGLKHVSKVIFAETLTAF